MHRPVSSSLAQMDERLFVVSDESGEIGDDPTDGLYFDDVRFLSLYQLRLDGQPLAFLAAPQSDATTATVQLTNHRLDEVGGRTVPPRTISVRRTRFLHDGLHEQLELVSYDPDPVPFRLELRVAADFRDMFDLRGIARAEPGELLPSQVEADRVRLRYRGRDGVERQTEITCQPRFRPLGPPTRDPAHPERPEVPRPDASHIADGPARAVEPLRLGLDGVLQPRVPHVVSIFVHPRAVGEPAAPVLSFDAGLEHETARHRRWLEEQTTRVRSSFEPLNRLIGRSVSDLFMLTRWAPTGPVPVAGIPWFACPFGRDSIITALEALSVAPELAVGTLRFLAARQGQRRDDWRDEEPGKIMHELRSGELANLGAIPHTPYYGSVDATPLFLMLLAETIAWLDDDALLDELWPSAEAALGWIDHHGDLDGDGLIEYRCRSRLGIRNQGWKDSDESATHLDGSWAEPPVALIEVQAYAYAARLGMAGLRRRRGDAAGARALEAEAARLRERVRAGFWLPELGCYAMALDRDKRPVAVRSSNAAHALFCRLPDRAEADALAASLAGPDMLSGWGLRTLSSQAPSYNPMSYHNGSIWPHDNAIAVAGLARCGHPALARELFEQVFQAAEGFRFLRLPELYCGFPRGDGLKQPAAYPVSCSPQAWAAGAPLLMLAALLGVEPEPRAGRLRLRPVLPDWLDWIEVANLRLGAARVGFRLARVGRDWRLERADGAEVVLAAESGALPG